jgi:hypothetical protein
MTGQKGYVAFAMLAMCLGATSWAGAHRVDEYLQASRIAVGTDRVDIEIDLTAGMSMASQVAGWVDTNGDGSVSAAEGDAYAREILRSVALSADGRSATIDLVDVHVPDLQEMNLGVGTIVVRRREDSARVGGAAPGGVLQHAPLRPQRLPRQRARAGGLAHSDRRPAA